jgi:two-component system, sensor histidine kinase
MAEAAVRIRDSGMGIAPEMLPRVFDLFTQADRALAHSQGGLGIGLSLVRSLVDLHGGRVSAFSEGPGYGSEFTVYLPLRMREPKDEAHAPAEKGSAAVEDSPESRAAARTRGRVGGGPH